MGGKEPLDVKRKAIGCRLPTVDWFQLDAFGFISRNSMAMISGLRPLSPLWCLRHHLSPRESVSLGSQVAIAPLRTKFACHPAKAGAQQPVLYLEPLMNTKVRGALLSHRLRGEGGGASHQRGAAAHRRHLYWRRKAPTSPIGQPTKRKASYWAG